LVDLGIDGVQYRITEIAYANGAGTITFEASGTIVAGIADAANAWVLGAPVDYTCFVFDEGDANTAFSFTGTLQFGSKGLAVLAALDEDLSTWSASEVASVLSWEREEKLTFTVLDLTRTGSGTVEAVILINKATDNTTSPNDLGVQLWLDPLDEGASFRDVDFKYGKHTYVFDVAQADDYVSADAFDAYYDEFGITSPSTECLVLGYKTQDVFGIPPLPYWSWDVPAYSASVPPQDESNEEEVPSILPETGDKPLLPAAAALAALVGVALTVIALLRKRRLAS
jgi:hypothetical protein